VHNHNSITEANGGDLFANGQSSRDLRGSADATEKTRLGVVNVIEPCPMWRRRNFPPIGKLLGLMIKRSGTGGATVEFKASGRYSNAMGTLRGVLCDLADAAMGVAYRSTLSVSGWRDQP
jgi:hypothetical protein